MDWSTSRPQAAPKTANARIPPWKIVAWRLMTEGVDRVGIAAEVWRAGHHPDWNEIRVLRLPTGLVMKKLRAAWARGLTDDEVCRLYAREP